MQLISLCVNQPSFSGTSTSFCVSQYIEVNLAISATSRWIDGLLDRWIYGLLDHWIYGLLD
jgi:hypothetical protein